MFGNEYLREMGRKLRQSLSHSMLTCGIDPEVISKCSESFDLRLGGDGFATIHSMDLVAFFAADPFSGLSASASADSGCNGSH